MSVMGQDYGEVREVGGVLIVDVFGSTRGGRVQNAFHAFAKYLGIHEVTAGTVASVGVDAHDPMVERFKYIGPR